MSRYTNPTPQLCDGNGDPVVGAKKFFFSVDTLVKKTVYSDSTFSTAIANPVLSDADGRFPEIFLDGLYDEVQMDNTGTATGYDGAVLWGPIPVGEVAEGPLLLWATDNTYNIPDIVLGSDDEYYQSLTDSNTGNNPTSSPGSWKQLKFNSVWNINVTYGLTDTVYGSDGVLYTSTSAANVGNNPPISPDKWRPATNQNQSAIAAGTVDAITAAFPVTLLALNDEMMVTVRASGANTSTTPTFNPDSLGAKKITKDGNQPLVAGDIFGAGHELQLKYNATNLVWELMNPYGQQFLESVTSTNLPTNSVVKIERNLNVVYTSGSAIIPFDDTIPQSTEGTELQTFAFTPEFADSDLIIKYTAQVSNTTVDTLIAALFKDAETDALAATFVTLAANESKMIELHYRYTLVSASEVTFKIRMGAASGVQEINGASGARKLGGATPSIIEVTEVRA